MLGVAAIGGSALAAFTPTDAACFSALLPNMPRPAAGRRASHAPRWQQGHDREESAEPSGIWDDDDEWTRSKRKVRPPDRLRISLRTVLHAFHLHSQRCTTVPDIYRSSKHSMAIRTLQGQPRTIG